MDTDALLLFTEHVGRFYAKQYGFPPVAGRLLGYLTVCDPMEQSIGELAEALLTSRSAITGAVKMLESRHLVNRRRPAGSRADLVSIKLDVWKLGFDPAEYREQARLAREGLKLLTNASPERQTVLEDWAALADFLVDRMGSLYDEWLAYRDSLRHAKDSE